MLNKEVCKTCINKFGPKMGAGTKWQSQKMDDEGAWKNNRVTCPFYFIRRERPIVNQKQDIRKLPPKHCRYALEHLVEMKSVEV